MIIPFPQEAVTCCSNGSFRLFIPLTQVMCLFAPLYLYPFPSGIGHLTHYIQRRYPVSSRYPIPTGIYTSISRSNATSMVQL